MKLFKCQASSSIHAIARQMDVLFKALRRERKMREGRVFNEARIATLK